VNSNSQAVKIRNKTDNPCSQAPTTGLCPESCESSLHLQIQFLKIHLILSSSLHADLPSGLLGNATEMKERLGN